MKSFHLAVCALLVGLSAGLGAQQPVDTTITYQGSLEEAGQPANGSYDLSFQLYDGSDAGSGTAVGSAIVTEDVAVNDGVFTVMLDFGAGVFDGEARWLEIGVRDGASTGGFTLLSPFSPITPAPQARFAVNAAQAANADQATNAIQFDGMTSGDFALAGHAHAALSAGDGLAGANYDGTGTASFSVGAGDGIAVAADEVAARVDGAGIGFNAGGELTLLEHGPAYGEVATVAKSGADYTNPVAAMNDLSNWCSQTVTCVLRIMPGLYDLTGPLELQPLVHVVGTGPFTALRRNDTGITSGVVDASNCGGNTCQMNNLLIATQSTGSGSQSVGVYSQGGRVELDNIFFSISSTTDAAFGILTDSNTRIVDSEFQHFGDAGSPVRASNGRIIIRDSEIKANGGGAEAIGVDSSGAALLMARNEIDAVSAVSATAVKVDGSFIQDRRSRLYASGVDYSRAIHASNCSMLGATLIGTELHSKAATTRTESFFDTCPQIDTSEIKVTSEGSNGWGIAVRESPLTIANSRVEGGEDAIVVIFDPTDTNSYPIRVSRSRLIAPDELLIEAGPYDDTAVALSHLENGTVSGTVTCTNNVDENFADLGNTCP